MKPLHTFLKSSLIIFTCFSLAAGFAASPKKILFENITNASRAESANADPVMVDYLINNYRDIIPIFYHNNLAYDKINAECSGPNNYRVNDFYKLTVMPFAFVNGVYAVETSNSAEVHNRVITQYGDMSPITLNIDEKRNGKSVEVSIGIQTDEAIENKRLHIAVVEFYHHYPEAGTNGQQDFYFIVRDMLPSGAGELINMEAGGSDTFTQAYVMDDNWNADDMYIVAFIQDDSTREVLQAESNLDWHSQIIFSDISSEQADYGTVPRGGSTTYSFSVTNPGAIDMKYNVSIDYTNSALAGGWNATLDKSLITLAPGESETLTATISSNETYAGYGQVYYLVTPMPEPDDDRTARTEVTFSGSLTEDTRNVAFATSNTSYLTYYEMFTHPALVQELAYVPLKLTALEAYPPEQYDMIYVCCDHTAYGFFGGLYDVLSDKLIEGVNKSIEAGKKVFITAEYDMYMAFSNTGTQNARDFFTNLGISCHSSESRLSGNYVYQFSTQGIDSDILGGLDLTHNVPTQQYPIYSVLTDFITVDDHNIATPFLYYDNDSSKIGGVRIEKGDARIVYMSCDPSTIVDGQQRSEVCKRILDWLWYGTNDVDEQDIPANLISVNACPNPMKESTRISYTVNGIVPQTVNIRITDERGSLIESLVNETLMPGDYEYYFVPKGLAAGTYFIVVNTGIENRIVNLIIE